MSTKWIVPTIDKAPGAARVYGLDLDAVATSNFQPFLDPGLTIQSVTSAVVTGPDSALVLGQFGKQPNSQGIADTQLFVAISGGTSGVKYTVTFTFVLSDGTTDQRSMYIQVTLM